MVAGGINHVKQRYPQISSAPRVDLLPLLPPAIIIMMGVYVLAFPARHQSSGAVNHKMARSILHHLTRTLLILFLVCGLVIAVLAYYIGRLELDDYRQTFERHLSTTLQQPVTIGSSALTYHQGLAIEFRDIIIGADKNFLISIPRLATTLLLPPLMRGKLRFEEISIDQPQVHVRPPLPDFTQPSSAQSGSFISGLIIHMLRISNADLFFYPESSTNGTQPLQLTNVHAVLRNWQAQSPTQLIVSGQSLHSDAEFLLETLLPVDLSMNNWRFSDLQARLQMTGFPLTALAGKQQNTLPKAVNIEATLEGQPAQGATVTAIINQTGTGAPVITSTGLWHSSITDEKFTTQAATFFGLPVEMQLQLQHQPRTLTAQLAANNLLLTKDNFSSFDQVAVSGLKAATLDNLTLYLEQSREVEYQINNPQLTGKIALSKLDWENMAPWSVSSLTSDFTMEEEDLRLEIDLVTAEWGSANIAGKVRKIATAPQLDLRATAQPQLTLLHQHVALPDDWTLTGSVPINLSLQGDIDQPAFQLHADTTQSQLTLGQLYHKPTGQSAHVEVNGSASKTALLLDQFSINLRPLTLTGSASVAESNDKVRVTVATQPLDMTTIASLNPALERFRLQGHAAVEMVWTPDHWQGELSITDGGAQLTSLIGELNSVTGRAALNRHGLSFHQLPAKLGQSTFIVDGIMRNWSAPHLHLEAKAPTVQAQDLVFFNPELMLYDVHGKLEISRHGIWFNPVMVSVEKATRAIVYGSVTNFNDPLVEFDILGERANVLDIISLFRRSSPVQPTATKPDRNYKPIVIRATAAEGTLGGMKFTNAQATITEHNGVLSIYPLTFESGGGWSRAKVEYLQRYPTAPLKISGHVDGIDASALHQDLLDGPGLIRGSLTGDFYLEGNPADGTFWQHATGGVFVQVKNGTLRRFRGLARVFSLLNVSQIFTGNLPDMDRQGMPFQLLEGSAQINAGLLHTDDLKITSESMNMSLVGTRDLTTGTNNMILAVMPLRTVDKVVSSIPIAGWVLAGEDQALLTAYFKIEGTSDDPMVTAIPVGTVSGTVLGIFRRTLGLPEKLLRDFGSLFQPETEKKTETTEP